uniref:SIS domain-containing protein n=1 Tax=Ciona savignyi TaxID=51511 RepID=H2Z8J3_CIOSA
MFEPRTCGKEKTLFNSDIIDEISKVAEIASAFMTSESNNAIVLSGCGTSGRLAFMTARSFNQVVPGQKFSYTIAGGDKALFTSQEAPEDDRNAGVQDLIRVTGGKEKVLFIGISVGLSAPYVAGQLDYCMDKLDKYTPVLVGFNPVNLARNIPIHGWEKTFRDVATRLEKMTSQGKTFLINPVVGGEAITGSSRMKGGSVTIVILQTIFTMALSASVTSSNDSMTSSEMCKAMLETYQKTCQLFYASASSALSSMITNASESFKQESSIYNVGSDGSAVMGIIDATECPPTYGATLDDIRGFILGGYDEFNNAEGDIRCMGEHFKIGSKDLAELLKSRGHKYKDTIIVLIMASSVNVFVEISGLFERSEKELALPTYLTDVFVISMDLSEVKSSVASLLTPSGIKRHIDSLIEICSKWIFNAISTGAHICIGKVLHNYMVDLKVSNRKLFHRSIGIIQRFCPTLSETEATDYLLQSIYGTDDVELVKNNSIQQHIQQATPQDRVVPTAIVMGSKRCLYAHACQLLSNHHVIREALSSIVTS